MRRTGSFALINCWHTESTLAAVRALGVEVAEEDVDVVRVGGVGLRGLRAPEAEIDAGNSGTLIRLLPGLLAGQDGTFTLTGDESLRSRPMERIAEPLRKMGAGVRTTEGRPPLIVTGGELRSIRYRPPMPSPGAGRYSSADLRVDTLRPKKS